MSQLCYHVTYVRRSHLLGAARLGAALFDFPHEVHPLDDLAEDAVLAVQVRRGDGGDKELRTNRNAA
eukprot:6248905-Pyramimonas_sp.AAC.2